MRRCALGLGLLLVGLGACGGPAQPVAEPAAAPPRASTSASGSASSAAADHAPGPGAADQRIALLRALADDSEGEERLAAQHRLYGELAGDPARQAEARAVIEELGASPDLARWERGDQALYDLASSRQAARDRAGARAAWQRLLTEHPRSALTGLAHLGLADAAFEDADLVVAEREYLATVASPDRRAAVYARYKLGWVYLNLARADEALDAFVEVVRLADDPLRREALKDVVRAYAEGRPAAGAVAFFEGLARGQGPALTLTLAELYADHGRVVDAAAAYALAIPLTDLEGACRAARGLDELERLAGRGPAIDAARAALADWQLADRCPAP